METCLDPPLYKTKSYNMYRHAGQYHVCCCLQVQKAQEANNSTINVTCILYEEDGTCKKHLQKYTECLEGSDSANAEPKVYVSSNNRQTEADMYINILRLSSSNSYFKLTPKCLSNLEPLLCLHFIHLCNRETNKDIGQSEKQCLYIKDVVCKEELKRANEINLPILTTLIKEFLSSCEQNSPFDTKNCISLESNHSIQNCSAGFYLNESGSCLPECNVWTPYTHNTVLITDILAIIPAAVTVLSGFAVLLFSWSRCEKV